MSKNIHEILLESGFDTPENCMNKKYFYIII